MRACWALLAIALSLGAADEAHATYGFVSCSSENPPGAGRPGIAMRNLSGGEEADVVPIIIAYRDWLRQDASVSEQITRAGNYPHVVLAGMSTRCRWYADQATVVAQIDKELKKLRKKKYGIITTMWTPVLPPKP